MRNLEMWRNCRKKKTNYCKMLKKINKNFKKYKSKQVKYNNL
jgi:hypothetical protein